MIQRFPWLTLILPTHITNLSLCIKTKLYFFIYQGSYPVLKALISDQDVLELLQYLPSIISLNKMLSQQFSGKLQKSRSDGWTVRDFWTHLKGDRLIDPNSEVISNFQEMIDHFLLAW